MALIPNGKYLALPIKATLGETKSGDPQIGIELELTEAPHQGQRRTYYGTFGEKAFDITAKALRTCGWTGSDPTEPISLNSDVEVQVEMAQETYKDPAKGEVTKDKVKWINSVGGGIKPMDANKSKTLAPQLKAKFLAFDQANGIKQSAASKASRPTAAGADPASTNDDIPF
jgi:hypothetical protein